MKVLAPQSIPKKKIELVVYTQAELGADFILISMGWLELGSFKSIHNVIMLLEGSRCDKLCCQMGK